MPVYSYSCDACGTITERVSGMHDRRPATVKCQCGKRAERDIGADLRVRRDMGTELWCDHNPHLSEAVAVHPDQVAAENAAVHKLGLSGVKFRADGMCVATSRAHFKEYCERTGTFNKDGGYGDASPGAGHVTRPQDPKAWTFDIERETYRPEY